MTEQIEINGTIKMTARADGTIRIEAIGKREYMPATRSMAGFWTAGHPRALYIIDGYDCRDAKVGDEGCLGISYNTRGDEHLAAWLTTAGIAGNMGDDVTLHGWRGTTNDRSTFARGWRRVESIAPRKRGLGWVMILSADLRPDED